MGKTGLTHSTECKKYRVFPDEFFRLDLMEIDFSNSSLTRLAFRQCNLKPAEGWTPD